MKKTFITLLFLLLISVCSLVASPIYKSFTVNGETVSRWVNVSSFTEYDSNGNELHSKDHWGEVLYEYDTNGNLIKKVQRDSNGNRNRVYAPDGKYTKPDASYVIDGQRYNTNYVSNYGLDNIDELNREIEAFNRMCDADPDSITQLIFKY